MKRRRRIGRPVLGLPDGGGYLTVGNAGIRPGPVKATTLRGEAARAAKLRLGVCPEGACIKMHRHAGPCSDVAGAVRYNHLPSCVRFSGYPGTENDCSCGAV